MAQQIKKKFLGNDQVDGSKLLLLNGQTIRKLDGSGIEYDVVADIESQISAEESRALTAEGALASDIADVNTRVDNVLSNVDGTALNSLSEIVTAFQAADDDLNGAITLLASDLDTRIDGVDATVSAIDGRLTTAEGNISNLQGEKVNKSGDTMSGILRVEDNVEPQNFTQVEFGSITLSSVDAGTGNSANGTFNGGSIVLETELAGILYHAEVNSDSMVLTVDDGTGAVPAMPTIPAMLTTKAYVDQEISALSSGGVASVQSELDATQVGAGLGTDGSYTAPVGSNYLGSAVSLKDADSKLDAQIKVVADGLAQEILDRVADVDAEESRALSAEGLLQSDINAVASDLAQEILDREADVDAEETRAINAENALDARVSTLENALEPVWTRQKFDLTATNISNGYIDLAQNAIAESIHAFVDRLAIHQGEDFTVSVVGSVTRITFAGDLVSPGNSSLDASDNIYVRYQYLS